MFLKIILLVANFPSAFLALYSERSGLGASSAGCLFFTTQEKSVSLFAGAFCLLAFVERQRINSFLPLCSWKISNNSMMLVNLRVVNKW